MREPMRPRHKAIKPQPPAPLQVAARATSTPLSQPEPGKALVYFIHLEMQDDGVTNKVGSPAE
jgi:hypothetical protein